MTDTPTTLLAANLRTALWYWQASTPPAQRGETEREEMAAAVSSLHAAEAMIGVPGPMPARLRLEGERLSEVHNG